MGLKVLKGGGEITIPDLTMDQIIEAVEADDSIGFCIYCGAETSGVEPDARDYECENCERQGVYGAEELMMMVAFV